MVRPGLASPLLLLIAAGRAPKEPISRRWLKVRMWQERVCSNGLLNPESKSGGVPPSTNPTLPLLLILEEICAAAGHVVDGPAGWSAQGAFPDY